MQPLPYCSAPCPCTINTNVEISGKVFQKQKAACLETERYPTRKISKAHKKTSILGNRNKKKRQIQATYLAYHRQKSDALK